jgi:antitoxin component YwqK of YwqJK toxin-antitoxin module
VSTQFQKFLILAGALAACCGGSPPKDNRVQATYDKQSGKLVQLTIEAKKDGKGKIYSYMDGTKFLRIEIDNDGDGKIDRWEYYGPDQKLEKVGFSRANDGKPDAWAYQAPDGSIGRVEISSHRDGKIDRTEYYEKGVLVRAEVDGDGDGKVDKWETYENGVLATVSFDTNHSGKPTTTIDYRKEPVSTAMPAKPAKKEAGAPARN